jgi:hypothetical protein
MKEYNIITGENKDWHEHLITGMILESGYRKDDVDVIMEKIIALATDGLLTDGGHHKQWYLEQILLMAGVDLNKLRKDLNTPDKNGDWYDWDDGMAP